MHITQIRDGQDSQSVIDQSTKFKSLQNAFTVLPNEHVDESSVCGLQL